jgi:diguanylate cyclase (GGDEF)-like protein
LLRLPLDRLARRGSVLHLLVILTLIPTVGLPFFGWAYVHDVLRRSAAAERIEGGLRGVAELDRLRLAVGSEFSVVMLQAGTVAVTMTSKQRATLPSKMLSASVPVVRKVTDAALATVRADGRVAVPELDAQLRALTGHLAASRALVDRIAANTDGSAFGRVPKAQKDYTAILSAIDTLEREAIHQIATGRLGTGTARLLEATTQIQAVGGVVLECGLQSSQYFSLLLTRTDGAQLAKELNTTIGSFSRLADDLTPYLSPQLHASWQRLLADDQISRLRATMAQLVLAHLRGRVPIVQVNGLTFGPLMQQGLAAVSFTDQMSALMAQAVAQGVAAARHDRVDASKRAQTGMILIGATMVATAAMLIIVGGTIRWRLRDLAASAQRLSAGRLEPMRVRGPREVALASEGLNDAVTSLREITSKAELVALGDLGSPMLEQPSPGPLGAAMHASFELVVTAVRERERLQHELAHQAAHDSLTKLPNRAAAERLLTSALRIARAEGTRVALLFLDLDYFKACNDTYGHHAGDHVLRVTAERITGQIRSQDVACRLGGDEFVVILRDVGPDHQVAATAERIVAALGAPVHYAEDVLHVGASVGITVWPSTGSDHDSTDLEVAEQMLTNADAALYRAKAAGRNLAVF